MVRLFANSLTTRFAMRQRTLVHSFVNIEVALRLKYDVVSDWRKYMAAAISRGIQPYANCSKNIFTKVTISVIGLCDINNSQTHTLSAAACQVWHYAIRERVGLGNGERKTRVCLCCHLFMRFSQVHCTNYFVQTCQLTLTEINLGNANPQHQRCCSKVTFCE